MASDPYSAERVVGERPPFTQPIQPYHHHYQQRQHQHQHQQHGHQHQNPRLYHHHHQQHQHQHQQHKHHQHQPKLYENGDSQFQLSANTSGVQSSAPTNLLSADLQALHPYTQSPEQVYSPQSSNQDQCDRRTSASCQCETDIPSGAPSSPSPRAPCSPESEKQSPDKNQSRSLTPSLPSQCGKRKFSDLALVENVRNRRDRHRSSTYSLAIPSEVCEDSKRQRVIKACVRCRVRKQKCSGEDPCYPCQKDEIACEYHETTSVVTKKNVGSDDQTLQQIKDMLQKVLDQMSDKVQYGKPREDICNSASLATPTVPSRPQEILFPPLEEEHRAGPHHLIGSWPSIARILQESRAENDRDYVMRAEERPSLMSFSGNEETNKLNKTQALDANAVSTLYESYMNHIHIMQPFLDKRETLDLLQEFIEWHGKPPQTSIAADSHHAISRSPFKRRHRVGHTSVPQLHSPKPNFLLGRAVVYLILALGEICMHNNPMVADSSSTSPGRMRKTRSISQSFDENSSTSRTRSQIPSVDEESCINDNTAICNVPGLVYYVKATELFGSQSDGNDLIHAHLFLLAGLYKGQLARVKESMSWYTMAGRILRQLLHSHGLKHKDHWTLTGETLEARSQRVITDKRRRSIVLASYSCIQLESDILAVLDLPSSGIVSLETMLPMPEMFPGVSKSHDDPVQSANNFFHFTSQVYLRVRLNEIHKQLYGPDCKGLSLAETRCILQGHETIIEEWRKKLPASMYWNLGDPPPTNILQARLRAKYWGARYLINRPFLDFVLHIKPHPRLTVDKVAPDSHRKPRREVEFHLFRAISEMSEQEVEIGYQTCIEAAEKSTIAFDNVLGRPIVTNIHGTAHA